MRDAWWHTDTWAIILRSSRSQEGATVLAQPSQTYLVHKCRKHPRGISNVDVDVPGAVAVRPSASPLPARTSPPSAPHGGPASGTKRGSIHQTSDPAVTTSEHAWMPWRDAVGQFSWPFHHVAARCPPVPWSSTAPSAPPLALLCSWPSPWCSEWPGWRSLTRNSIWNRQG